MTDNTSKILYLSLLTSFNFHAYHKSCHISPGLSPRESFLQREYSYDASQYLSYSKISTVSVTCPYSYFRRNPFYPHIQKQNSNIGFSHVHGEASTIMNTGFLPEKRYAARVGLASCPQTVLTKNSSPTVNFKVIRVLPIFS